MQFARRVRGLAAIVLVLGGVADAQVPPTDAEARSYTGLHAAAWQGDVGALRAALAAGGPGRAAIDSRDGHGRTPLHVATHRREREVVRVLAHAGADLGALDRDRYDAVTIAAVADDEESLAVLLELGASARQITSRYDGTALIAAAHLGHDGVVRRLIAAGAPLDHVNNLHWTAVIEAIVLGDGGPRHQQTLKALVEAKANLQLADRSGATPLQLARARGHTAMVQILQRAGAR
jgi:ankyrin repeat protein